MNKSFIAALILTGTAVSTNVFANQYNSFSNLTYTDYESGDSLALDTQYYFDKRVALGPLNQFDYINAISNVNARIIDTDADTSFSLGGEYFANSVMFGAQLTRLDDADVNLYRVSGGYLFADNIIAKINYQDSDNSALDGAFSYELQYVHEITGKDYLGFTLTADEKFDTYGVATKYFTQVGADQYFVAKFDIRAGDADYWMLHGDYYFNKMTSVFASYNKIDDVELGARFYFNDNWATSLSYSTNTDTDDDMYRISVRAQF